MRWKQIENEPKTLALIFDTSDEIASMLQEFVRGQGLAGSSCASSKLSSPLESGGYDSRNRFSHADRLHW